MVTNKLITTTEPNGVKYWILLRISAIIIFLYILYILGFIETSNINYQYWYNFFSQTKTKIFTIITLLSIIIHAYIGLWQIITDYVKLIILRILLQTISIVMLIGYLIYGTIIMLEVQL